MKIRLNTITTISLLLGVILAGMSGLVNTAELSTTIQPIYTDDSVQDI